MVVYADILFVVNLIVDYFLLRVSLKVLKTTPKSWRIAVSAVIGGLFSFYIFLPKSPLLIEILAHLLMNSVMMLVCMGFKSVKTFLRGMLVHFGVVCCYGGVMTALWQIFKPQGMIINNSVVYFNISPVVLIITTVFGYFLYMIFSKIFAITSKGAKRCNITLYALGKSVGASAIIDTGNSISDIMSDSEVIIADKSVAKALFGNLDITKDPLLATRYRTIPCNTVSGNSILEGFRCDICQVYLEDKIISLNNPILAISKTPIKEDYSVILNPKILSLEGTENEKTQKLSV
ncbi:MAG: sigma-E processing peptidase SpoIIGA [Clostridia bacterium]|nr:sigma-E processing peptidase SpoIIGA [Clostridia bacterium]